MRERQAVKELIDDGWLTYRVPGSTKWNKSCDIFSLFDIIALKREGLERPIKWIQVKSRKLYGKQLDPFYEFKRKHCSFDDSVEIWIYEKRKLTKTRIIN